MKYTQVSTALSNQVTASGRGSNPFIHPFPFFSKKQDILLFSFRAHSLPDTTHIRTSPSLFLCPSSSSPYHSSSISEVTVSSYPCQRASNCSTPLSGSCPHNSRVQLLTLLHLVVSPVFPKTQKQMFPSMTILIETWLSLPSTYFLPSSFLSFLNSDDTYVWYLRNTLVVNSHFWSSSSSSLIFPFSVTTTRWHTQHQVLWIRLRQNLHYFSWQLMTDSCLRRLSKVCVKVKEIRKLDRICLRSCAIKKVSQERNHVQFS